MMDTNTKPSALAQEIARIAHPSIVTKAEKVDAAIAPIVEALEAAVWHLEARVMEDGDEHVSEALVQAREALARVKGGE